MFLFDYTLDDQLGGKKVKQKMKELEKLEEWGNCLQKKFPEVELVSHNQQELIISARGSEIGIQANVDQVIFTGVSFDFGGEWKALDDRVAHDMEKELLADLYSYQTHYVDQSEYFRNVLKDLPEFPYGKETMKKQHYVSMKEQSLER